MCDRRPVQVRFSDKYPTGFFCFVFFCALLYLIFSVTGYSPTKPRCSIARFKVYSPRRFLLRQSQPQSHVCVLVHACWSHNHTAVLINKYSDCWHYNCEHLLVYGVHTQTHTHACAQRKVCMPLAVCREMGCWVGVCVCTPYDGCKAINECCTFVNLTFWPK